jgi:WD40 repeat protein
MTLPSGCGIWRRVNLYALSPTIKRVSGMSFFIQLCKFTVELQTFIPKLSLYRNMFASGSPDNIKQWKCPDGKFIQNLSGHNAIVNCLAINPEGVLVSGGDNGTLHFWDWRTGYNFQRLQVILNLLKISGVLCVDLCFRLQYNQDLWTVKLEFSQ